MLIFVFINVSNCVLQVFFQQGNNGGGRQVQLLDKDFYTSLSNTLKVFYVSVFSPQVILVFFKFSSTIAPRLVAGGDGGERQVGLLLASPTTSRLMANVFRMTAFTIELVIIIILILLIFTTRIFIIKVVLFSLATIVIALVIIIVHTVRSLYHQQYIQDDSLQTQPDCCM